MGVINVEEYLIRAFRRDDMSQKSHGERANMRAAFKNVMRVECKSICIVCLVYRKNLIVYRCSLPALLCKTIYELVQPH